MSLLHSSGGLFIDLPVGKHPIRGVFDPPSKKSRRWVRDPYGHGGTHKHSKEALGWLVPSALTELSVRGVNRKLLVLYQVS